MIAGIVGMVTGILAVDPGIGTGMAGIGTGVVTVDPGMGAKIIRD